MLLISQYMNFLKSFLGSAINSELDAIRRKNVTKSERILLSRASFNLNYHDYAQFIVFKFIFVEEIQQWFLFVIGGWSCSIRTTLFLHQLSRFSQYG